MDIFLNTVSSINDNTRVEILNFINANGEVCVCDIENSFSMIQSRISRHLKILKDGGFLKVDRRGRWAFYSIRAPLDEFRQSILKEISFLDIETPSLNKGCKMNKKVLILCTGNSCRSIIAEAVLNRYLDDVDAQSSGVKASGKVNPLAKKVLQEDGSWDDKYHSKTLDKVIDTEFDLVVTVCDNAKESCPIFPKRAKVIHVGYEDPDGKDMGAFEKTLKLIKFELIPIVRKELGL